MAETKVHGESEVRENIAEAFNRWATYVDEDPIILAGSYATESLAYVEAGTRDTLGPLYNPIYEVFGDYPHISNSQSREHIRWQVDEDILSRYQAWCEANCQSVRGIIGVTIKNSLAIDIAKAGMAEQLGVRKFTRLNWNLERVVAETRSRAIQGNGSLRSQDAMSIFGGGCIDRDPRW